MVLTFPGKGGKLDLPDGLRPEGGRAPVFHTSPLPPPDRYSLKVCNQGAFLHVIDMMLFSSPLIMINCVCLHPYDPLTSFHLRLYEHHLWRDPSMQQKAVFREILMVRTSENLATARPRSICPKLNFAQGYLIHV